MASAVLRRAWFGRVARARASTNVVLVVSFRTAVRFICLLRGDFGFPSLFGTSSLGAWAGGAGTLPRPRVRLLRPPRRPLGVAPPRPFGFHRFQRSNMISLACVQISPTKLGPLFPRQPHPNFIDDIYTPESLSICVAGVLPPRPRVGVLPPHPRCVFHVLWGVPPLIMLNFHKVFLTKNSVFALKRKK